MSRHKDIVAKRILIIDQLQHHDAHNGSRELFDHLVINGCEVTYALPQDAVGIDIQTLGQYTHVVLYDPFQIPKVTFQDGTVHKDYEAGEKLAHDISRKAHRVKCGFTVMYRARDSYAAEFAKMCKEEGIACMGLSDTTLNQKLSSVMMTGARSRHQ